MAKVNRAELARLLDCSLPTITSKVAKGMPFIQKGGRGKEWMFDTAAVITWEKDQAVANVIGDLTEVAEDELKRRKLAAETTIVEIEAAKAKSEVVPVSDVEKSTMELSIELATRMMLVGKRCFPYDTKMRQEVDDEVRIVLNESINIELDYDEC